MSGQRKVLEGLKEAIYRSGENVALTLHTCLPLGKDHDPWTEACFLPTLDHLAWTSASLSVHEMHCPHHLCVCRRAESPSVTGDLNVELSATVVRILSAVSGSYLAFGV